MFLQMALLILTLFSWILHRFLTPIWVPMRYCSPSGSSPAHNEFIYVSTEGSDVGSVGVESSPFKTIQAAIDYSLTGDSILVNPGTYIENINYNGKDIVIGSLFLTTQDTSYIESTVIDGNEQGSVVTFNNGEDTTAVLSGFFITNGNGTYGSGQYKGGGIYCLNSGPIINSCKIAYNSLPEDGRGGAIYAYCMESNIIVRNSRNNQ